MQLMQTKKIIISVLTTGFIGLLISCSNPQEPGYTFVPDMAYSKAYEPYSSNPNFDDSTSARVPVKGTIPRGALPDNVQNSVDFLYMQYADDSKESYESAGNVLSNPLVSSKEMLADEKDYTASIALSATEKVEKVMDFW